MITLKTDWLFFICIAIMLIFSICSVYTNVAISSITILTTVYGVILNGRYANKKEIFARQQEHKARAYSELIEAFHELLSCIKSNTEQAKAINNILLAKQKLMLWASEDAIIKLKITMSGLDGKKSEEEISKHWNTLYKIIRNDLGYADSNEFLPYNFVLLEKETCK